MAKVNRIFFRAKFFRKKYFFAVFFYRFLQQKTAVFLHVN